jgi:hypothetical protein
MPFAILDRQGQPLIDIDGKLILVRSKAEAREFLMPGDGGVVSWDWRVAQNGQEAPQQLPATLPRRLGPPWLPVLTH